MPRKIFQDKYDKDGIVVKWAGIGDVYSIGGWCADMEEGDVCYECSPDFEQTWSHDQMIITAEKSIVGYSIGIDCTLTEENGYAKQYAIDNNIPTDCVVVTKINKLSVTVVHRTV